MTFTRGDGETWAGWTYDPTYVAPLPKGAIRGDITEQQGFCWHCRTPHYYYLDQGKICIECGRDFVFSAEEQKYWYETLKFTYDSTAVRCVDCRRDKRRRAETNTALQKATRAAADSPSDPDVLLAFARAAGRHFQASGVGKLDKAIAACRRARKLNPQLHETWYWEAMSQELLGRPMRALDAYETFLETAKSRKRILELKADAEERVAALGCTGTQRADAP